MSELLLLISAGVTLAVPAAFKYTVAFFDIAFGSLLSTTVTTKLHDAVPQVPVTFIVTVVCPTLNLEPLPVPAPLPVVAPLKV